MYEEGKTSKEIEELSRAISEAITKSDHVKRALTNLTRERQSVQNTRLVMMLRVRDTDISVDEVRQVFAKGVPARPVASGAQYIDGKKLSPLEIAFEEHCIQHFDEHAWLKKLKIRGEDA